VRPNVSVVVAAMIASSSIALAPAQIFRGEAAHEQDPAHDLS
jgi:hypothetical protein